MADRTTTPDGIERIPPQNIEAEQAVLGAMLIKKEAISTAAELLTGDDFYRLAHRLVFEAIMALSQANEAVDMITVTERLKKDGELEKAGGIAFITALANAVPTAANVAFHARIVRQKAQLRQLINAATEIAGTAYEDAEAVDEIMDDAEKRILDVTARNNHADFVPMKDILIATFEQIEKHAANKGALTGLPSGFVDLDRLTSGFQPSDLILVAARPSMGKTAFTLNIATNAAIRSKKTVAFFSLEMSKEQLGQRLLSMESRIESQKMSSGDITDDDWISLAGAVNSLGEGNILIDDTPGLKMMEIKNKCRRVKNDKGLDLIILDYLQLMVEENIESRQQQVSNLSRGMKLLAREMECPVIVLSQLSRKVEARDNKRPLMSDLRESGAIEQDADVILFLYRDEVYNEDTEKPNICEVIVAKHRNGPIGTVEVGWQSRFTKFVNLQR